MSNQSSGQDREMYYNKRIIKEIKANSFHRDEMGGDLEVPEPVCDGQPLGSASPSGVLGHEAFGSDIAAPIRFEWITAQWAWHKQRDNEKQAQRLRVSMTFMTPEEIGTQQKPHKITFYLTDRHREFQATNPLQQQVVSIAGLKNQRWIGKARIRQPRGERVQDHHRRNIPDLVMTAAIVDTDWPYIQATLYTPEQQITLDFNQTLSLAQQKYYEGGAVWGRVPERKKPVDDFHDWMRYA